MGASNCNVDANETKWIQILIQIIHKESHFFLSIAHASVQHVLELYIRFLLHRLYDLSYICDFYITYKSASFSIPLNA